MTIDGRYQWFVPYDHIEVGQCFLFEGALYLRTEETSGDPYEMTNGVRLDTGDTRRFDDNEQVISVSAKVVIE